MWNDICFYCLRPPTRPFYTEEGKIKAVPLGIDRLESHKSYTQLNVVSACSICNYAKSDQTIRGMLNWMQRIRANPLQEFVQPKSDFDLSLLESKSFKALFKSKIRDAAGRNKEWKLSPEEALKYFKSECFYCLAPPSNCFRYGKQAPFYYTGIDRYNNNVDYIEGNCVPACKYCNRAKLDMPEMWFSAWVFQMQNNIPRLIKEFKGRKLI